MRILLLNQCFYPDVVATGQYLSDLARGLVARGHHVTVVASRRGYDNPDLVFPARESWHGVDVRRIWTLNLGKTSKWRRAVTFASFWSSCILQLLLVPRCEVVVALTSPPLISFLAALLVRANHHATYLVSRISYLAGRIPYERRATRYEIRAAPRAALLLWLMDLNPDEALAAGWLRPGSVSARVLMACQRYSFRVADRIVALDRFMAERVARAGVPAHKISVIPPWSHDDSVHYDHAGRLAFRAAHGLSDKYVVMYSGNHSPCHPLDTLLEAARRLQTDPKIAFCFIGGGSEFARVQSFAATHRLANIVCLPYQPLETLSASLSAADVQVVVMGNAFVGIIHPCKPYNILAVGLPLLYIGPEQSHIADLLKGQRSEVRDQKSEGAEGKGQGSEGQRSEVRDQKSEGAESSGAGDQQVRHGEVDALAALIRQAAGADAGGAGSSNHGHALAAAFSKSALLPRLIELVEGQRAEM